MKHKLRRTHPVARAGAVFLALVAVVLLGAPIARAAQPSNDSFGGATAITSLPYTITLDTTEATVDASDPLFCASPQEATVWFALTTTQNLLIDANTFGSSYDTFITVVTGAPGAFNGVICSAPSVQFLALAGQTYSFMIGRLPSPYPSPSSSLTFSVTGTPPPPPQAGFYFYPSDPSPFDTIQFYNGSYDPAGAGFESAAWDFGDGATATDCCPTHKYAADGDYTVHLTVTTVDGRTGSISQVVQVRTHDVAIVKIAAPNTGRVNQKRDISVSLASKLAAETVHIELYKSDPSSYDGFQSIGYQELLVPTRSSNRTVTVNFGYTFTSGDASIGKVTFKAVATIVGGRDALPTDNEARATTKVTR